MAGKTTIKLLLLATMPAELVTVILPGVAPAGTLVVIDVAAVALKLALTPLKLTLVTPMKFVPVSVTLVPAAPLVGVNDVKVGALMIVKLLALAPVPAGVVTLILPDVVATAGVALI
jgi:hypothetical protein